MAPSWLRRAACLLAISGIIAFALHREPSSHHDLNAGGHHCCLCHTTGITPVSTTAASAPPTLVAEQLPYYEASPAETALPWADVSRGPPAA